MLRRALIEMGLTLRESDVAEQVARGLSNRDVADKLNISEKTVKFHLTHIYRHLRIKSRTALMVKCIPHMKGE